MGWTYVTLILSHCILLYSISLVKIRWLCFATGLCTLATFKCEPFVSWQVNWWLEKNKVLVEIYLVWICFYCQKVKNKTVEEIWFVEISCDWLVSLSFIVFVSASCRQVLWRETLTCVMFCSMEVVDLPSCAVWALLWRTVNEKTETTASWSCSSTTSTSRSSILGQSWPLINFMFKWVKSISCYYSLSCSSSRHFWFLNLVHWVVLYSLPVCFMSHDHKLPNKRLFHQPCFISF